MSIISDHNIEEIYTKVIEKEKLTKQSKFGFEYIVCSKDVMVKVANEIPRRTKKDNTEDDCKELSVILNGNTDLIPNQYEGGFKVWEGLFDLIDYFQCHQLLSSAQPLFKEDRVINILDLGCGSGLLGIYLAQQIRSLKQNIQFRIYLQDYNENVIRFFTIPNVVANEKEDCKSIDELVLQVENSYTFLFGDWKQINDVLHNQGVKFDWIVTAETLYCEENYSKLYKIFSSCLRKPGGEVLIATKSHYFGVGGGAISFLDYLDTRRHKRAKSDQAEVSTLEAEIVKDIESTLLRHIIQLRWPS